MYCVFVDVYSIRHKVFVVIMFDKAARVLFVCSADEFFDFAKLHPVSDLYHSSFPPDFF